MHTGRQPHAKPHQLPHALSSCSYLWMFPKPLCHTLSFHVCWSSGGSFILTRFTFFPPLYSYLQYLGGLKWHFPLCPDILTLLTAVWHGAPSWLVVLQMPQLFCALGNMQRSNGYNSVLWTTEEGECHQRSPQSTPSARMFRLADQTDTGLKENTCACLIDICFATGR